MLYGAAIDTISVWFAAGRGAVRQRILLKFIQGCPVQVQHVAPLFVAQTDRDAAVFLLELQGNYRSLPDAQVDRSLCKRIK